jgi:hypothetical protein
VPTNTAYYTLNWLDAGALDSSYVQIVYIDDFCSNYDRYVVHFLNELGNYDSFTFNLLSRESSSIERKDFRNSPYYLNTSNKLVYDKHKGDRRSYSTIITNKITLNSDWISEETYYWLKQLVTSPDIILEQMVGSGDTATYNLLAAKCTNNDYTKRKTINDKIINFTIDLEFDYQDIRQRG